MSQLIRVCVLGAALAGIGCGGSTAPLGPVEDTKQVDPEVMKKAREESMNRNNAAQGGRSNLQVPGDQNKTP